MASSDDDEGELVTQSVTDYHFVNDKEEPISFSVLPIQWSDDEIPEPLKGQVFLRGTVDYGLQKIYKQVTAWKFELSDENPEISVFSKEKIWIKLQKPRKSFEVIIRTILITVRCLGFVKKNPEIMGRSLWDNLRRVFSTYEVRPYENDLLYHLHLISDAVKRDNVLSKSKFLLAFIENPWKRKTPVENLHSASAIMKSKFIVDGEEEDEDDSDQDVCAICDNGGELVCCDGRCLRSFHGTVADGEQSKCESLCLSEAQLEGNFVCANCRYKQHQCYACGRLGSSDKNFGTEVFPCVSATCGHFYHPECVAKLLHPGDESEAEELQIKIAAGESFICPAHRCHVCKKSENLDVRDLCFALCRRCPKAYHRKCLPRKIAFEDLEDQGIIRRAWDGLLSNKRVLIYCLKHRIDKSLETPFRNILFPKGPKQTLDPLSKKGKVTEKRKFVVSENNPCEKIVTKKVKQIAKEFDGNDVAKKRQKNSSGQGLDFKMNVISTKPIKSNLKQWEKPGTADASRVLIGEDKFLYKDPEQAKCNPQKIACSKFEKTNRQAVLPNKQKSSPPSLLDAETKEEIVALMRDVASSVTFEEVVKNHLVPSTYAYSKDLVDKTITVGRVDAYVKAVKTALQNLEDGYSVEDAKAVCGPEILNQLIKWRNKLRVYLAPFLHGTRYTSFGRHFTKVDKLKEVVDKLHWYVQNDDVIVDFCCGANDFSWLMKEKLYENGKNCSFKNYDIIQPKNDFDFEKRDWMSVWPEELPTGSKLIMGLNPPFGVKAALANKFINRALEFEPKLLILIVPEETERLDKKEPAYDLIWEDDKKFSGKSFYLPGSVDVYDNQMEQWNMKPPRLYLWSRSDWTTEHKAIALKHGHLSKDVVEVHAEDHDEAELDHPMDLPPVHKEPVDVSKFMRECNGISGQTNGLPEKQNEEKSEEKKSTVPRKCNKSSLPKHPNSNRHGDVDTKDHNYNTVMSRSLKKQKDKNNEEKSEKNKSAVSQNCDKISLPKRADCSRHGDDDKNDRNDQSVMRKSFKKTKGQNRGKQSREVESIRPGGRNNCDLSQAAKMPRLGSTHRWADAETLPDGHPHEACWSPFPHGTSGTDLDNEMGFGRVRTSVQRDDFDDSAWKYTTRFASGTDKWSPGTQGGRNEYGIRGLDVRTHCKSELDDRNETNVRQLRSYGWQNDSDYSAEMRYLHGPQDNRFGTVDSLSYTPYGVRGLASDSSYGRMSSSAMHRYAPQLDELNHRRMNSFEPETMMGRRSSMCEDYESQYPLDTRTGFNPDSWGVAPRPRHPL